MSLGNDSPVTARIARVTSEALVTCEGNSMMRAGSIGVAKYLKRSMLATHCRQVVSCDVGLTG